MADDPNANLIYSVSTSNLQGVLDALVNGANPNIRGEDDNTPLLMLAGPLSTNFDETMMLYGGADDSQIMLDIMTALLDAGADPNLQDRAGYTALMHAARHDVIGMIALLISRGADERIRTQGGITAWDLCRSTVCRQIIMNKQKREFKQQATNTIPMLAAQYSRSTPQTRREWLKILLLQKHAEFCDDEDSYRYLGALWGLAEILGVGYGDIMFNKSDLCDRIRERLRQDV